MNNIDSEKIGYLTAIEEMRIKIFDIHRFVLREKEKAIMDDDEARKLQTDGALLTIIEIRRILSDLKAKELKSIEN